MRPSIELFALTVVLAAGLGCSQSADNPGKHAGQIDRDATQATAPAPRLTEHANPGFDQALELQGITFHVTSANSSSINTLHIVPGGLEIDNSEIAREIDGTVTGAEVADLNADGSPEVYVYINSAGSGSYGSLAAYSANNRKSLSDIYLPPVTENAEASVGYMGHDEFAVVETRLVQRFPIYREGDTNAAPSGDTRQIQYKLVAGEAGWRLEPDKVVEY